MAALGGCQGNVSLDELAANILGSQCPFRALGLTPDTTLAEVKTAYRRLSLVFHPDKCSASTLPALLASEVFQALQRHYTSASQQLQPVQQPHAVNRDLWGQFYAAPAPAAQSDAGCQAAPAAGLGPAPRPAHAARQGSLWGSARGPLASAWNRQNTAAGPSARPATAAGDAEPGAPEQKDAGPHRTGVDARSTGQPKHAAAATAQLRRPRAGGHVPAAVKPFTIDIPDESADAREVLAESPHSPKGGAVPAGKRRCTGDADGGSAPRATSRPAGLVELLRKRRSASGQQGPACAVADRPGSPRLVEGTESEHANISFLHTGVDGEAAGDVPEPAPTAGAATAPGPHAGSAWARRPVFGVAVRQAPAFAELDRGDRRESGGERRPHQQGRQRRAAAAALGGGEKLGRARARHRLAPRSPGPSSESCSGDSEASGSGSLEDLDATAAADDDDENDVSSPSASSGNPASSSDNSEGIWDVPEGPGQNTGSTAMGGCGAEAVPQAARDQSASASGRRQRMQPSGAARAGTKASAPAEADVDRVRSTADAVPPAGISWHPSGSAAAGGRGSVAFGRLRQQLPLAQVGDMAWSHKARGAAKLRPVAASGAAATPLATAAQEEAIGVPQPRSSFTQTEAEAYAYGWPQGTAGEQRERQRSQLGVRKATTSAVPSASFYGRPRTRCASPPPSPSRLHCSGADEGAVTAHESRQPLAVGRSGPAAARDGAVADIADPGHETYTVGGSRARPERAGAGASGRGDNGGAFAEHHGDAPAWMGAAPDHVERHWKGGSAAGLNASGGDAEECCDVVLEEGGGHCAEGGDADPDDAWWDEPLGAHDDEAQPGGSTHGDAEACTQTLDMFLKQVQRGGELQAQRAGQMRLGNLRRTALLGRRGKARGGGATRSGATSGSKGAGGKGRGGANGPGGRSGRGRGGSADILRYSRPIKG